MLPGDVVGGLWRGDVDGGSLGKVVGEELWREELHWDLWGSDDVSGEESSMSLD